MPEPAGLRLVVELPGDATPVLMATPDCDAFAVVFAPSGPGMRNWALHFGHLATCPALSPGQTMRCPLGQKNSRTIETLAG
jgi:hypothetical protein